MLACTFVEEGAEAESQWEPWDVRRSLFDNHISPSTEANLEYMWKKYGFYIPDSQFLVDPEGLIKYLVRSSPGPETQTFHIICIRKG